MKMLNTRRGVIIFLLFFLLTNAGGKKGREIRVLLGELSQPAIIEGRTLKVRSKLKTLNLSGKVQFTPLSGKLMVQEKELGSSVKIISDGIISINGQSYRGRLQIENIDGHFMVINFLELEDYLAGVVKNEMSAKWPFEALKAQTVLARTYALIRMKKPRNEHYDLYSTVDDQVYSGMNAEDDAVWRAIKDTSGEVIFYNNEPAQVYYHSCCGGWTEAVEYVWGGDRKPYLSAVQCDYCQECPYYFWRYPEQSAISPEEMAQRLGYQGESVSEVIVKELSPGQRVVRMELKFQSGHRAEISGSDFRVRLGRDVIRSTLFKVEKVQDGFIVFGSGSGHGVGLCQWGAKGMAEAGKDYREILQTYFPGTEIRRIY